MKKKDLMKKDNTEEMIVPIVFDTMVNIDGTKVEVTTPYNVFNAYAPFDAEHRNPETVIQEDVMIRRFSLVKIFENRVKFLFEQCLTNLNNRIHVKKQDFDKQNDNEVPADRRIGFYSRYYIHMPIHEERNNYGMIFNLFSYAGFNNYINGCTYIDISNIIVTEAYNKFVMNMREDIVKYGYDILNYFTDCFMTFHKELLDMFGLILDEVDNIYGPAGFNDFYLEDEYAKLLADKTSNTKNQYVNYDEY